MSDVTTIPAAVLAEARALRDALCRLLDITDDAVGYLDSYGRRDELDIRREDARALLGRHWPAATPDRYAAGFRDGVEKAAGKADERVRCWSREGDAIGHYGAPVADAAESASALREARHISAAIRSLAPPDDALLVGRLRWVEEKAYGLWRAYVGELLIGTVFKNHDGTGSWAVMHNADIRRADTPEAARAALVAAVRREVEAR